MLRFLKGIYRVKKIREPIIIVSGLPRSGTSMIMKMLKAGGITLLTDNIRKADQDNPQGYYELEKIKNLHREEDKSWIGDAKGKALKVISELLKELPSNSFFKLIFMDRDLEEVIISQNKMLIRRGEPSDPADNRKMMLLFEKHLRKVKNWIRQQSNFEVIFVDYKEVLEDPIGHAERIKDFLQRELDVKRMAGVVDKRLYRSRSRREIQ
ncbi:MAG: sulfotransferase [Acidobacteria bacterium]|nr:sulfotransferase [Acidobacteriota bacterium]